MPIAIQVWLYECSSSIDIQVAQKEGIENQVEGQYSNLSYADSTSYEKNSDDDFHEPPPPIVKDKRKGKVCSSSLPIKKRMKKQLIDGAKQAVQKIEPHLVTITNLDGIDSKTVEHEVFSIFYVGVNTINNSDDIGSKADDNEPSFAFDIPQKAVSEVSEEAHEMPQVSEEAYEHAEEQFPCPVPIQPMDPMNVTTHSQFELDDHFMPSFNSIKSNIAPQSTTIANQITTTVNQTSIVV
ncbi:hypothetical protein RDI58_027048 [Solanum bulbocastanum]|uniref:Ulp1 protease family, C-terminal catalytic domain containing protein n=1 Tax=Solanum bulbocastanum TaxID=147425 RepID=A0AAN8SXH2_SOLBU